MNTLSIPHYERHRLSGLLPDMPADEYALLVEDVRQNEVHDPIILLDGQILDGWHRYRALKDAGLPRTAANFIHFEDFGLDCTPARFVISKNIRRRHLSAGERATLVATIDPSRTVRQVADQAEVSKDTAAKALKAVRKNEKTTTEKVEQARKANPEATQAEIAEAAGVSQQRVSQIANTNLSDIGQTSNETEIKEPEPERSMSAADWILEIDQRADDVTAAIEQSTGLPFDLHDARFLEAVHAKGLAGEVIRRLTLDSLFVSEVGKACQIKF